MANYAAAKAASFTEAWLQTTLIYSNTPTAALATTAIPTEETAQRHPQATQIFADAASAI
jgi:hypothetical protein